mgnify:CR=1 FL=1
MKDATKYSVADLMTRNPAKTYPDRTVQEACRTMGERDVGSLLVIDGYLLGIITERDVVLRVGAENLCPSETKVSDVMTSIEDMVTVEPNKDIYHAMNLMKNCNVRRLPVVVDKDLVGIITAKDILRVESSLIDLLRDKIRIREAERKLNL